MSYNDRMKEPHAMCPIEIDLMKQLLLDMAYERSVEQVLNLVVERMAAPAAIASARVWLLARGDICSDCSLRAECPSRASCLHLVACSGCLQHGDAELKFADDPYRRVPIGETLVGRIALTGQPIEVSVLDAQPGRLALPESALVDGIRAFGGQPLLHRGELLGVLAVFTRACLGEENLTWMRMIANHAAAAIANAKAFEENERLQAQLEQERDYLRDEVLEARAFGDIVGQSPSLQNVLNQIQLVAPTEASALILGESGTGKELVAREIHRHSLRKDRPLIKVNCASIPRELYESEFFGHVKGAFTGAVGDRIGRFELADGGTLFLDEVGEIPLEMQSKLLRVLQEGEFERVGDHRTRHVDVRIVAATNRDLKDEIAAKRFREDLYYRLNVFPIEIAPLRQRQEDIPILAAHFVEVSARKLNRPRPRLTQANIASLVQYDWPGNIRELQNVIERAVITSTVGKLRFDLPSKTASQIHKTASQIHRRRDESAGEAEVDILTDEELRERERENILAALRLAKWKISGDGGAADLLGLKATTLASRMKKMEIARPV